MKLRIKGNSIRLRLTQSDVAEFAASGKVEESIEFGIAPDQKLFYEIIVSEAAGSIKAEFKDGGISVSIPKNEVETWANGTQAGIGGEQKISNDSTLKILVEKDFACLAVREGEDESDNFPHPKVGDIC